MKLLIITPEIPYPIHCGGNRHGFTVIDELRKFVNISILLSVKPRQDKDIQALQQLWPNVTFFLYREKDNQTSTRLPIRYRIMAKLSQSFDRTIRKLKNNSDHDLIREYSITSAKTMFYEPLDSGYISFVDSVVKTNIFDLIEVNYLPQISIVHILPKTLKKVFIHHELGYVRYECEQQLFKNITTSDTYMKNYSCTYELQHLNLYDAVVCLTEVDRSKLIEKNFPSSKLHVSPPIFSVNKKPLSPDYSFNQKLIYLGGSSHFPNYDAVDWFLNTCWDTIHNQNPTLEFHIIGNWKSRLMKKYEQKYQGVRFRGFVDDLSEELSNSIMIVPLRIGSGVRIKILDSISLGCPIISTRTGAEGLDLEDEKDILYADNPKETIAAVKRLTNDNRLCQRIREGAHSKLLARKSFQELISTRLEIYNKILS